MKITIIGAGIGGLSTGIALIQKGFEVEIFESSPAFKRAGSGINLAINAMQIYKRLGVYEDIMQKSSYTNVMNITTKDLKVMTGIKLQEFEKMFGAKTVAIHRASLHEILLQHIGDTPVHLNKKLKSLEQKDGKVALEFEDGSSHTANILIGADGIHSAVRKSIFENTVLRDAKQICWRGISPAKISEKYQTELNEVWDKGKRFGFVHISKDEVYWYALINKNKFTNKEESLLDIFSSYHSIIQEIITQTPREKILCNEIWDLKRLDKWYRGNVCLVGDAAHATTPNMGQGAVQAIESAMALSICLKEEKDLEKAFSRYQSIRKRKADYIVDTSWSIGKLGQTDNVIIGSLRNFIAPLIPDFVTKKQNKKVFELNF